MRGKAWMEMGTDMATWAATGGCPAPAPLPQGGERETKRTKESQREPKGANRSQREPRETEGSQKKPKGNKI